MLATPLLGLDLMIQGQLAFAIALTTTAYGTLAPILADRGLGGTPVGKAVETYGPQGKQGPAKKNRGQRPH